MTRRRGFTLIEMMLGTTVMVIVLVALMGAFVGQSFLTNSARNLTAAMNDATRVMEEIRRLNTTPNCAGLPTALPPDPYRTWNAWLNAEGQGKSVMQSSDDSYEVVAVTCQRESGGAAGSYCGPNQVGTEWARSAADTTYDPIRVTVAVGWRQQQRVAGGMAGGAEFIYTPERTTGQGKSQVTTPASFVPADTDRDGAIESQAMLTTLVTCR
jgi:prepilin-type N-terminal cleavage/methylation domain-containing protein